MTSNILEFQSSLPIPPFKATATPQPKPDWAPPTLGTIKVNVDASFCPTSGLVGIAEVGRDNTGAWVGAYLRSTNSSIALMAELLVIREGFLLCSEKQWSTWLIASDCKKAVNLILASNSPNDSCIHIILDCRELMSRFPTIQLQFEGRETNTMADALAREARRKLKPSCKAIYHHHPLSNSFVLDYNNGRRRPENIVFDPP